MLTKFNVNSFTLPKSLPSTVILISGSVPEGLKITLPPPISCFSVSFIAALIPDDNLKSFYSIMNCDLIDAQQIGLDTVIYLT